MKEISSINFSEFGVYQDGYGPFATLEDFFAGNPTLPVEIILRFNPNLIDRIAVLGRNQDGTYHIKVTMLTDNSFAGTLELPRCRIKNNTFIALAEDETNGD